MIRKVKLGEISDLSIGFVGTVTSQYEDGGIPFLRTLNVKPYKIVDNDLKRITSEFHNSQKKSQLFEGDIAMVHTGIPGISCVIPKEYDNSNCIDMIVVKPNKEMVDSNYLCAYMNTYGYKHIEKKQVGCIQKHFNLSDAIELEVFIPELNIQKQIGDFVGSINKVIENNLRLNSYYEKIINAIYNRWFLQFEFPDVNNKSYKQNGGKLVWNDELKQNIPEGWKVQDIIDNSLCSVIKNGVDYFDTKNYLATANIIGDEIFDGENVTFDNRESRANMQPELNSVWFAKMKNSIKHLTITPNANWVIKKYILSTGFEGLKCKPNTLSYIHALVNSYYFEKHKDILSHGATQESVNEKDLKNIKFAVPTEEVLNKFSELILPILEMKTSNILEIQKMTELREKIIPMLINGQVIFD